MANNFYNKIVKNVSADPIAPSAVYTVPASKKTIVIELDVANRSTSSQTISVEIEDFTQKGSAVTLTNGTALGSGNTLTATGAHNLSTGDRVEFTNVTNLTGGIATGKQYTVKRFVEHVLNELNIRYQWRGKNENISCIIRGTKKTIIKIDKAYIRPLEVDTLLGNSAKARKELKWKPRYNIKSLISEMIKSEIKQLSGD